MSFLSGKKKTKRAVHRGHRKQTDSFDMGSSTKALNESDALSAASWEYVPPRDPLGSLNKPGDNHNGPPGTGATRRRSSQTNNKPQTLLYGGGATKRELSRGPPSVAGIVDPNALDDQTLETRSGTFGPSQTTSAAYLQQLNEEWYKLNATDPLDLGLEKDVDPVDEEKEELEPVTGDFDTHHADVRFRSTEPVDLDETIIDESEPFTEDDVYAKRTHVRNKSESTCTTTSTRENSISESDDRREDSPTRSSRRLSADAHTRTHEEKIDDDRPLTSDQLAQLERGQIRRSLDALRSPDAVPLVGSPRSVRAGLHGYAEWKKKKELTKLAREYDKAKVRREMEHARVTIGTKVPPSLRSDMRQASDDSYTDAQKERLRRMKNAAVERQRRLQWEAEREKERQKMANELIEEIFPAEDTVGVQI